ncbi:phosphotriesterase [Porifericola rhodea]|uniref:phosphotriesterase family protein n=1 Tax=Porifericola rhodea TaxID=930972 RepID=UPI002666BEBF|nr:phosphotriesterase [Porifericola rhodea]WKN31059.1 phosphotriesterase [Porifericola rhodea]
MTYSRRRFLARCGGMLSTLPLLSITPQFKQTSEVITVGGSISSSKMGFSLIHEHVLVDFVGAAEISKERWNKGKVVRKVLPYLQEIKALGCHTLVECTPAYLGRDVDILAELSNKSGLHIITNTGYYGARQNKFLPAHAFTETSKQLAKRWVSEFEQGIDGTAFRPGFIKTSVDPGPLSDIHKKLISAAALTHKATGMSIASHTGPAEAAFEQLEVLQKLGVAPAAFIWVHAQNEKDNNLHVKAAQMGAWVSLDGVSKDNINEYLKILILFKSNKLLNHVLLSHDAGWYRPEEVEGGSFRPYTDIFIHLIPLLKEHKFTESDIEQVMIINPKDAFAIKKRLV